MWCLGCVVAGEDIGGDVDVASTGADRDGVADVEDAEDGGGDLGWAISDALAEKVAPRTTVPSRSSSLLDPAIPDLALHHWIWRVWVDWWVFVFI